jgi:hypothetical protein
MSIIKKEYGLTEKKNAMFVACLMDSAIYESNGKISIVDGENLNDYINKLILEKKFIEANELIKSAKNVNSCDSITAEISSKSYRIPFEYIAKLLSIPIKNESLSDNIKRVIVPILYSSLDDLKKVPNINTNKLNLIETLINDWSKKAASSAKYLRPCSSFEIFTDNNFGQLEKDLFKKYFQTILNFECRKYGLDSSIVEMFIEAHSTSKSKLNNWTFIKDTDLHLDVRNGVLECNLCFSFSYGIDDETGTTVTDDFYKDAEEAFGYQQASKFYEIVTSLLDIDDIDEIILGQYKITFNNGELLINGTSLNDEQSFEKMIYDKLAKKYSGMIIPEDSGEVSYISLLPSNFDESLYTQELKDALSNHDYQEALKFSEALEIHEMIHKLSVVIYNIFKSASKQSKVATITIPNTLLSLLDLARENKYNNVFISEAIENFWQKTNTQGGIE